MKQLQGEQSGAGADMNARGFYESQWHPEDTCEICGHYNPQWYSRNDLFNKVNGSPNGIICPTCFINRANGKGIEIWLTNPPPVKEPVEVKQCGRCGGATVLIRGKYPGYQMRSVCPTCTYERLEQIQEISSSNYGIAVKEEN